MAVTRILGLPFRALEANDRFFRSLPKMRLAFTLDRNIEPLVGFRVRDTWDHGKLQQRTRLRRRALEFGVWPAFFALLLYYE